MLFSDSKNLVIQNVFRSDRREVFGPSSRGTGQIGFRHTIHKLLTFERKPYRALFSNPFPSADSLVMEYVEEPVDVQEEATARKLLDALAGYFGSQRFDFWLGCETGLRFSENTVAFGLKNDFAVRWVRANWFQDIERICREILGSEWTVEMTALKPGDRSFLKPHAMSSAVPTESATLVGQAASVSKQPVAAGIVSGPHFSAEMPSPFSVAPASFVPAAHGLVRPSIPHPASPLQTAGPARPKQEQQGRRFASLDNFVKGLSNDLACRAVELAVNHPGKVNPIYLHGPSSVGKTHLLEGIWTAVRRCRDRKPPLYMTAEQFISAFLESIQYGASRDGIQRFRARFRGISTLLIDDIQLLARAGATQAELLYLIDTLGREGVQIVLTGDRPLRELKGLRSEIQCRIGAGIDCAIELPDPKTSQQILAGMVVQRQIPLAPEICRMVASRLGTHARLLSGALNRLYAVHLSTGNPITVEIAEEALADMFRHNRRDVRLPDIEKVVCETFGLSEDALQSKSRAKHISTPRMLAMWLAQKHTRSALSEIGRYFGDRSHSSVVSARKKVDQWIAEDQPTSGDDTDPSISEAIRKIERLLQSG